MTTGQLYGYVCGHRGLHSDSQPASLREYASRLGRPLADTYRDGADALPLPFRDRPAGRRLLARLAPGDAVVAVSPLVLAPKLPRYSTLASALREVGVATHIVTGFDGEGLADSLREAFDPGEDRGARIRAGFAKAKAAGRRTSRHPPVGYRHVRRGSQVFKEPDPDELEVIGKVLEWHKKGYSWSQISRHLLLHKVKTASGGDWCPRRCRKAVEAAAAGRLPPLEAT